MGAGNDETVVRASYRLKANGKSERSLVDGKAEMDAFEGARNGTARLAGGVFNGRFLVIRTNGEARELLVAPQSWVGEAHIVEGAERRATASERLCLQGGGTAELTHSEPGVDRPVACRLSHCRKRYGHQDASNEKPSKHCGGKTAHWVEDHGRDNVRWGLGRNRASLVCARFSLCQIP